VLPEARIRRRIPATHGKKGGSSTSKAKVRSAKWTQRREAENEYEVGDTMSDETYLLQRIMGLETELSYFAESSRQQQIRHNTEISRLQNDNRKLQARLGVLQAENNTLLQNENRKLQARLGVLQAENNTLRVQQRGMMLLQLALLMGIP